MPTIKFKDCSIKFQNRNNRIYFDVIALHGSNYAFSLSTSEFLAWKRAHEMPKEYAFEVSSSLSACTECIEAECDVYANVYTARLSTKVDPENDGYVIKTTWALPQPDGSVFSNERALLIPCKLLNECLESDEEFFCSNSRNVTFMC